MRILNLEQGSTEWLLWRTTGIGSSDAPIIINGRHFGKNRTDLWREKLGKVPPKIFNSFIQQRLCRGKVLEPDARAWYADNLKCEIIPICAVHYYLDWCKASLDGWIQEMQTIVEIKAPNLKDHQLALNNQIPHKYIAQLDHQILVTGAKEAHYLSYNPDCPKPDRYAIVKHYSHPETLLQLVKAEEKFWNCLRLEIEPVDNIFNQTD